MCIFPCLSSCRYGQKTQDDVREFTAAPHRETDSTCFLPLQSELPFCYKSPQEQQLFVEIYISNMAKEMRLLMTDTRNGTEVWRASLRSGRNSRSTQGLTHLKSSGTTPAKQTSRIVWSQLSRRPARKASPVYAGTGCCRVGT